MGWFRKRPTEAQLELIVLRAATVAKAQERDSSKPSSSEDIRGFLELAHRELNLKPDSKQEKFCKAAVQALLSEGDFLDEVLQYQLSQPAGTPIPGEFRSKMLRVIQDSVNGFLQSR